MSDTCKYCDMPAIKGCRTARERNRCTDYKAFVNPNFGKHQAPVLEPEPIEDEHFDPLEGLSDDEPEPEPVNPKQAFGDKEIGSAHVPTLPIRLMSLALWLGVGKYGAFNWRRTARRRTSAPFDVIWTRTRTARRRRPMGPITSLTLWRRVRS
jgi:hypothetical protein